MKVHICAVGRLRASAEHDLIQDYGKRFDRTGRNMGLGPISILEVEDKKGGGMPAEAALLRKTIPTGSVVCVLDERGKTLASPAFADKIARWRDAGRSDLAFVIGGADGVDKALRAEADLVLSFGAMVWPHMLVRVMLSEQLYRAASILAGAPYHRA